MVVLLHGGITVTPNRTECSASDESRTERLLLIRAHFVACGTSFTAWCRARDINPSYARGILQGKKRGPAAQRIEDQIIAAIFNNQNAQ